MKGSTGQRKWCVLIRRPLLFLILILNSLSCLTFAFVTLYPPMGVISPTDLPTLTQLPRMITGSPGQNSGQIFIYSTKYLSSTTINKRHCYVYHYLLNEEVS